MKNKLILIDFAQFYATSATFGGAIAAYGNAVNLRAITLQDNVCILDGNAVFVGGPQFFYASDVNVWSRQYGFDCGDLHLEDAILSHNSLGSQTPLDLLKSQTAPSIAASISLRHCDKGASNSFNRVVSFVRVESDSNVGPNTSVLLCEGCVGRIISMVIDVYF